MRLSIAGKLLVSACWTIALVTGLAVFLRLDMVRLSAVDAVAASAATAEREVSLAIFSGEKLRVISQEIAAEQTDEAIASDLSHSKLELEALKANTKNASRTVEGVGDPRLEEMDRLLMQIDASIQEEARLRQHLLTLRDGTIEALHAELLTMVGEVRSDLVLEDLPPIVIDNLAASLSEYQSSIDTVMSDTMSYLATGQRKFHTETENALATGAARMADIVQVKMNDYTQKRLASLEAKRGTFSDLTMELLASIRTLEIQRSDIVRPKIVTLNATLEAASKQLESERRVAHSDAADARAHLLARSLYLSGAAVFLVILGNLLVLRSVVRPARLLTRMMQKMAAGDVEQAVNPHSRRDEIGEMMQALELLRRSVRDAFLQSQIIEQLPIGVMTLETAHDFRLDYINPQATTLLSATGAIDPQTPLVTGDPAFLQSATIRLLRRGEARLPCIERITVGDAVFDLGISMVHNTDGRQTRVMLTLTPRSQQVDLVKRFETSIAQIANGLSQSSVAVRHSAAGMCQAALDGEEKTTAVAVVTDQATRQAQSISLTVESLVQSINDTAAKIGISADMARLAASEAGQADQSIDHLGDAAERIGGIVRLIGEVAGRTKLLALNATIEAARAGESGRGFAVVAGEVKALASETAVATAEVSVQVKAMQGTARETMAVLQSVAGAIRRMSDVAAGILEQISEQQAALNAIVAAVKDITVGTADVTTTVGRVQQIVSHTGRRANQVLDATTALSHQAETLKSEAGIFLSAIQAAS